MLLLSYILSTLVYAVINTSSTRRPTSPLTIPSDDIAPPSPPVSIWSAATSSQEIDELFIHRVFSFDEWEYDQQEKPLAERDLNRYNDSLKSLTMCCHTETEPSTATLIQNKNSAFHKFHKFDLPLLDTTGPTYEGSTSNASSNSIPFCEGIQRQCSDSFVHITDNLSSVTSVSSTVPEYIMIENEMDRHRIFRNLEQLKIVELDDGFEMTV